MHSQAENAAEVQERKNRAARAQHFKQRAAMFDALKKKADRSVSKLHSGR